MQNRIKREIKHLGTESLSITQQTAGAKIIGSIIQGI